MDHYLERLLQEEDAEIAYTEALLVEAIESGDYVELNEAEWDRMESEVAAKLKRSA